MVASHSSSSADNSHTIAISGSKSRKEPASSLISRNVTIAGHRTSVRLEPEMWNGLTEICRRERANLHEISTLVAKQKPQMTSLTAAIRVFIMTYFRAASTEDGHNRARHGQGAHTMQISGSGTGGGMATMPGNSGGSTSGGNSGNGSNGSGSNGSGYSTAPLSNGNVSTLSSPRPQLGNGQTHSLQARPLNLRGY